MSVYPKIRKIEDKDESCRLRHGLNVHCLAEMFKYLDSPDLYTVGEMNEFYKQIIDDLVISKHKMNFNQLYKRGITVQQVFERYGTKIKNIYFIDKSYYQGSWGYLRADAEQLFQSITQYCSPNQLRSVKLLDCISTNLPNRFQNVERFQFERNINPLGHSAPLSVQLSESLRYLSLKGINLDANFDWTKLKNLTELHLGWIKEINAKRFIQFLHHQPNLEVFHHCRSTFGGSTQEVCEALAQYCGNSIRDYSGITPQNVYNNFLSGFKNVKKVHIETHRICCDNLIEPLNQLAENDTIDTLSIGLAFSSIHGDCIFKINPNLEGIAVKRFSNLKTINIFGPQYKFIKGGYNEQVCYPFELLSMYLPHSNVENMIINSGTHDWDIIKFVPKLRHLVIFNNYHRQQFNDFHAVKILSNVESILQRRHNGRATDDFIEIKFNEEKLFKIFDREISNNSIKLSLNNVEEILQ